LNLVEEEYLTLAGESRARERVKGSTFLAIAVPINTNEDADHRLSIWRKEFHDATHIVWARRLAPPLESETRWDDDGEPRGTAGIPILQVITRAEIWGVLVVVVRWFGGIKLGAGGLARAYSGAAESALAAAQTKKVVVRQTMSIIVPHPLVGIVYSLAEKADAKIEAPIYIKEGLKITLHVRKSLTSFLFEQLQEQTAGQVIIERQK